MRRFFTPLVLLLVGLVWLMSELGWVNASTLFWPLLLGIIGVAIWLDDGVHQHSFAPGAGFLLASVLMAWHNVDEVRLGILMPVWLIGMGVILMINRTALIAPPPAKPSRQKHKE